MAKAAPAAKKPLTKTELFANIAAATDVPKKQVAAVLEALAAEIKKSLGNKGAGVITIPGLVKIEKKKVPARKAQKGVPNPFQARRVDGPPGQARLQQGQGAGAEAAQGHGEVAIEAVGGGTSQRPLSRRGMNSQVAPGSCRGPGGRHDARSPGTGVGSPGASSRGARGPWCGTRRRRSPDRRRSPAAA